VKQVFSNEVITPGETTIGDLRRWMYDAMWEHSVGTWFQPDFRLQRRGMSIKLGELHIDNFLSIFQVFDFSCLGKAIFSKRRLGNNVVL